MPSICSYLVLLDSILDDVSPLNTVGRIKDTFIHRDFPHPISPFLPPLAFPAWPRPPLPGLLLPVIVCGGLQLSCRAHLL